MIKIKKEYENKIPPHYNKPLCELPQSVLEGMPDVWKSVFFEKVTKKTKNSDNDISS